MQTLTRKEREKQERESKILQLASAMLKESGYLGLSMDRIAAEMEYSKGTIYQHFPNKEEIILSLANEALKKRLDMFETASAWNATSRQRMAAIGAAAAEFVRIHPMYFAVDQLVRSASIWEKTSDQRRQFMQNCEASCMRIVGGIVNDAITDGDLRLANNMTAEVLVFGLWSMNFGAYSIITSSDSLEQVGLPEPEIALWHNQNLLLDGYGWTPLSSDFDYFHTFEQAKQELFGGRTPNEP
ncbi:TetR/AcrR family transcriptional regulator [Bythopirellula polymerisocia]|uniref:Fatty acid metabolism regulator protein n=1 Tax=Bythopirellula polymerisocia TaxID=2528003 RepID=A0A5C6D1F2_9BACT|nr:TetR/AcrR family transcriptional regulator [Bythopirellula polymerisocia]TWU29571.1 Fatty acid metabolism regulator protein [Bythopirellula polymerisocia]